MSQAPPPGTPLWIEHLGEVLAGLGILAGAVRGTWLAVLRWLRRRERKRELRAAEEEVLTALLDGARESLWWPESGLDVYTIQDRTSRRKAIIDRVRDRWRLARGLSRSAPSRADEHEDSEE